MVLARAAARALVQAGAHSIWRTLFSPLFAERLSLRCHSSHLRAEGAGGALRVFPQETPMERKRQNDAAPREFASIPDPEETVVVGGLRARCGLSPRALTARS